MKNIKDVQKYANRYNVLYVEDDEGIQVELQGILEIFFQNVVLATDGVDGFEKFLNDKSIDLIISDIQMPKMNGLEMAKKIREIDKEIPIIFTTAFSDQQYFLKSIDVKINKYILKPIEDNHLTEAIYEVSKSLFEKNEYDRLKLEDEQRKMEAKRQETISKLTDAFVSPTIIYKNGEVVYYSKPFLELFKYSDIDLNNLTLETKIFDERTNCLSSLKEFDESESLNNKVCIKQEVGKRIFKIIKKDIEVDDGVEHIYMFVDITKEEYQKVKINSYIKALELTVIKDRKISDIPKKEEPKLELSEDKTKKLRKRHNHVMNSAELVASLDSYIIKELQELDDIDIDLRDVMFDFNGRDFSRLHEVAILLDKYAHEIYHIDEFEDLYGSIKNLIEILNKADISMVKEEKYDEFTLYLKSVADDLALWRKSIFIDQNTDNIHYLDSSLFSTALHIEMLLNNLDETDTQEDDLEFF